MKKIVSSLLIGLITGIVSFYSYYTYKYVKLEAMIENIIYHEYIFLKNIAKIFTAVILSLIAIVIIYYTWIYLIYKPHKKLKQKETKLKQIAKQLQEEKQKLQQEKETLKEKMQQELEEYKKLVTTKAKKELNQLKQQLINQYNEKEEELQRWKKQENYEKEKLKRTNKCLQERIKEILANKFKETNPARYKKELKRAKKIIEECKEISKPT